jgi:hypothetical protein
MPTPLPLSSERLERHGLFLIEDGQIMFLWVGRDAVPQLVMDVFNLPSYEALRGGKVYYSKIIYDCSVSCLHSADHIASVGQSFQPTRQRCHTKIAGDASRHLLPTVICCERRWGDAIEIVGAQPTHPRSCGCNAKLPAIYHTVEGQGMCLTLVRDCLMGDLFFSLQVNGASNGY